MQNFKCQACGWIYNPAEGDSNAGIAPNTDFNDLPDDWTCPICGAPKDSFLPEE